MPLPLTGWRCCGWRLPYGRGDRQRHGNPPGQAKLHQMDTLRQMHADLHGDDRLFC